MTARAPSPGQHWGDCDADVRGWVEGVVDRVARVLSDVRAVYLHGSLAMGCYRRTRSDVDLLVVVGAAPDEAARRGLAVGLLDAHDHRPTPAGVEISVVDVRAAARPQHPVPYLSHFSERWVDDARAGGSGPSGRDPDLAAHLAVTRARGVALRGPAPVALIGPVARDDLLASVRADVEDALAGGLEGDPVDGVLNICRTLALHRHPDLLLSKEEGGEWALAELAPRHRPVVRDALAVYRDDPPGTGWDEPALVAFGAHARTQLASDRCRRG